MTSKIKCPFCGEELDYDEYGWDYSCSNPSCQKSLGILSGTEKLWQALIQAKQDLEIAREALTDIFFICELDASKDANTRISEIYAIAKKVLER